jgi:hypothetical protein
VQRVTAPSPCPVPNIMPHPRHSPKACSNSTVTSPFALITMWPLKCAMKLSLGPRLMKLNPWETNAVFEGEKSNGSGLPLMAPPAGASASPHRPRPPGSDSRRRAPHSTSGGHPSAPARRPSGALTAQPGPPPPQDPCRAKGLKAPAYFRWYGSFGGISGTSLIGRRLLRRGRRPQECRYDHASHDPPASPSP